jgi:Family of unknown function (DUF6527)
MIRREEIKFEFIESVPDCLQEGIVYVSIRFATAVHKCCCGCGKEVVTPFSPAGWTLSFDGVSISLHPSIGNWGFPCKSHYWIRNNKVMWVRKYSKQEIAAVQHRDQAAYNHYYSEQVSTNEDLPLQKGKMTSGKWSRIIRRFFFRNDK